MGPYHPPFVRPPAPARASRTESKAVLSLVLGLLSIGCVGPIAGVPALILGSIARRDIDRSNGALDGGALAAAGIVSGLFGTGLGFVLVLWLVGAALAPEMPGSTADIAQPASVPSLSAAAGEPDAPVAGAPMPASSAGRPAATLAAGTRSYGSLEVVDLDASRSLRPQLAEITKRSRGRTVLLQTYAKTSAACAAVAAALPDRRMQGALANVTLVRVDVEEYEIELTRMKIETATAPWFYKLDAKGNVTDAISADAWDESVPENMAPVLGRFVHRSTPKRRGAR